MTKRQPTPGVHENFANQAPPEVRPGTTYINRADGKRCEVIAEDAGVITFKPEGSSTLRYLGMSEFVTRFELQADTPPPESQVVGVDIPRLPVGTAVEKVGGYPFPGIVVAAFHTLAGQERFVVEATGEAYAGMLHIFNGGQLRAALASEGQQ